MDSETLHEKVARMSSEGHDRNRDFTGDDDDQSPVTETHRTRSVTPDGEPDLTLVAMSDQSIRWEEDEPVDPPA